MTDNNNLSTFLLLIVLGLLIFYLCKPNTDIVQIAQKTQSKDGFNNINKEQFVDVAKIIESAPNNVLQNVTQTAQNVAQTAQNVVQSTEDIAKTAVSVAKTAAETVVQKITQPLSQTNNTKN